MPLDLEELRAVAIGAVQAGMRVVRDAGAERVTAVDHAAEAAVTDVLEGSASGIPVVGEMSGGDAGVERVWVVDPLDGTANFASGDSFVAVTTALLVDGQPVVGATGCPFTAEVWSAARGLGAHDVSGRRLAVVARPPGSERIALDPQASDPEHLATWSATSTRLTGAFAEVVPLAAIALELAYVAAGAFDGIVQVGGSDVQDFAAGVLLIREAGGLATGLDGNDDVWASDLVIAGAPQMHDRLRELLRDVR